MSLSTTGRGRRAVFSSLVTSLILLGLAGSALLMAYWSSAPWRERLKPLLGPPDEALIWQVSIAILIVVGVLLFAAYLFSFDSRAQRRPLVGMILGLAAAGLYAGTVISSALFVDSGPLSLRGKWAIAGMTAALPLAWLGFEALARQILDRLLHTAESSGKGSRAILLNRMLLLFRPGRRETLRSVALERFRRGDRDDEVLHDLQTFHEQGDSSEEILQALCRLAAERRDAVAYLLFLNRLHTLLPDDADLAETLIAENLAQGHKGEALHLIERRGVGESPADLERYARLLLDLGEPERAVETARRLAAIEGVPFKRSNPILQGVADANPRLFHARNLLAEQELKIRGPEAAIKNFEASLAIEPNQPRVKRQLIELYRETHASEPLQRLLGEQLATSATSADEPLAIEYADLLILNKNPDAALEFIVEWMAKHGESFALLDRQADLLCERKEWDKAAELNERAQLLAAADDDKARCRRRVARMERALLTAELYDLQEDVARNPANIERALELVRRLVSARQVDRAIHQADALLGRRPEAREALKKQLAEIGQAPDSPFIVLSYLADLRLADGEFEGVIALIDPMRARSLTPDAVELDLCQKILHRAPNHLEALRREGDIHKREHRLTEMVHSYVLYLAHGGAPSAEMDATLFRAYADLKDYPNALIYGKRVSATSPDDAMVPLRLAQLAFDAGKRDESLEWAKIARERNPKQMDAGRLILKIETMQHEERAKQLQARVDAGGNAPADLEELADLLHILDQGDKSIPLYQKAARDAERSVRCRLKMAVCLAERGLFDIANETVQDLQVPADTPETLELLELLYILGGLFEAERMLEKAAHVYKMIFLVDAGFRDVVKKVERFS